MRVFPVRAGNRDGTLTENLPQAMPQKPARFFGVTADKPPRTTTRAGGESRANTNGWRVHGNNNHKKKKHMTGALRHAPFIKDASTARKPPRRNRCLASSTFVGREEGWVQEESITRHDSRRIRRRDSALRSIHASRTAIYTRFMSRQRFCPAAGIIRHVSEKRSRTNTPFENDAPLQ